MKKLENIPMLDASDTDFKEQLNFAIWSTGGSSDYRNDRERPYNGQPHTCHGERGKQEISGITMRDMHDCIVQGFLDASGNTELQHKTVERNKKFIGTPYENKNDWRDQDVYKIECDFDPIAVIQNALCHIENMMGIFPNVPELKWD